MTEHAVKDELDLNPEAKHPEIVGFATTSPGSGTRMTRCRSSRSAGSPPTRSSSGSRPRRGRSWFETRATCPTASRRGSRTHRSWPKRR